MKSDIFGCTTELWKIKLTRKWTKTCNHIHLGLVPQFKGVGEKLKGPSKYPYNQLSREFDGPWKISTPGPSLLHPLIPLQKQALNVLRPEMNVFAILEHCPLYWTSHLTSNQLVHPNMNMEVNHPTTQFALTPSRTALDNPNGIRFPKIQNSNFIQLFAILH